MTINIKKATITAEEKVDTLSWFQKKLCAWFDIKPLTTSYYEVELITDGGLMIGDVLNFIDEKVFIVRSAHFGGFTLVSLIDYPFKPIFGDKAVVMSRPFSEGDNLPTFHTSTSPAKTP